MVQSFSTEISTEKILNPSRNNCQLLTTIDKIKLNELNGGLNSFSFSLIRDSNDNDSVLMITRRINGAMVNKIQRSKYTCWDEILNFLSQK